MSECALQRDERLLQLLADRATEGVTERDAAALDEVLALTDGVDAEALDRTAAALAAATLPGRGWALPVPLRERILEQAGAFFARRDATGVMGGGSSGVLPRERGR